MFQPQSSAVGLKVFECGDDAGCGKGAPLAYGVTGKVFVGKIVGFGSPKLVGILTHSADAGRFAQI
jgi:hypothetical protein